MRVSSLWLRHFALVFPGALSISLQWKVPIASYCFISLLPVKEKISEKLSAIASYAEEHSIWLTVELEGNRARPIYDGPAPVLQWSNSVCYRLIDYYYSVCSVLSSRLRETCRGGRGYPPSSVWVQRFCVLLYYYVFFFFFECGRPSWLGSLKSWLWEEAAMPLRFRS